MEKELITGTIGTCLSAVGTGTQTNEVLQTISLIITIIGGIITFIVVPILSWYKKAKEDDKIDKDEIKDMVDIVSTGVDKIKEDIKDKE